MKKLISLCPLLLLSALVSAFDVQPASKRHEYRLSLKHPYYYPDNSTIPFFKYAGDILAAPDHLRLASSVPGHRGIVYAEEPNKFREWEVELSILVYGRTPVGSKGMGFWYTKEQIRLGDVMGATDAWNGLAILFDTYDPTGNRNMPYVMAIVNDGSKKFLDTTDPSSLVTGACYLPIRNTISPVKIRISYTDHDKLSVMIDHARDGKDFQPCFTVSNVKLFTDGYFGISAASGQHSDDHELLEFETYELNPKPKTKKNRPHEEEIIKKEGEFKLSEEQQKLIEEVEKKANKIKQKDDVVTGYTPMPGSGETDTKVVNAMRETQFKIIESLDNLHQILGSSSGSNLASTGSDIKSRLDDISSKIDVLVHEMKYMAEAITLLTQQVQVGSGPSAESEKIQQAISDINNRLHNIDSRTATQNAKVTEHLEKQTIHLSSESGSYFWAVLFIMVMTQVFLMIYQMFKKRSGSTDKKFI